MVALVLIALICAIPLVLGYRLVSGTVSTQAANGVLLLVLGAGLATWLLSNLSFDAGL